MSLSVKEVKIQLLTLLLPLLKYISLLLKEVHKNILVQSEVSHVVRHAY